MIREEASVDQKALAEEEVNKVPVDIEEVIEEKMSVILRAFRRMELFNAEIIQRLDRLENRMASANIGGELPPISRVPATNTPSGRAYLDPVERHVGFDLSRIKR